MCQVVNGKGAEQTMLEQPYLDLAKKVLDEGHFKPDRTHTGTYSIFGHQCVSTLARAFHY